MAGIYSAKSAFFDENTGLLAGQKKSHLLQVKVPYLKYDRWLEPSLEQISQRLKSTDKRSHKQITAVILAIIHQEDVLNHYLSNRDELDQFLTLVEQSLDSLTGESKELLS
jgi:hypothetical protein